MTTFLTRPESPRGSPKPVPFAALAAAVPHSARHGVLRGQIDISARLIWQFEKLSWAWQVRWPTPQRLARLTKPGGTAMAGP